MSQLTIQIVNYKTKQLLEPLIASVINDASQSKINLEINVLDNASGDNLDDIAKRWSGKGVNVYYSKKNGGFGAGHNFLARKSEAKYLLLLNPDTKIIEKNTVSRLLKDMEIYRATIVGPRLLTPDPKDKAKLIQQKWDHYIKQTQVRWYLPLKDALLLRNRNHDELTPAAWVSGAVFLIERASFMEVGGFDERFFLYYEELDLCRRLRKKGKTVIYDPTIRVIHYGKAVASKRKPYFY